jgi:hypothetical protein
MGLCVALQSESGEKLNQITDDKNLLIGLLGDPDWKFFPMLASIDRYGDTVFNCVQIEHFLFEWESLFAKAMTSEDTALLQAIKLLGETARDHVHQYLAFIGD